MAITALPTPPSRSTPSTFSTLADAWIAQFTNVTVGEFNTSITTANTDMSTASTQAGIATTQASNAAASAAAAAAAGGATLWVSGTTYAIGDVRFSPINYLSYRRKTAGAGTTDPSADTTNWTNIAAATNLPQNSQSVNYTLTISDAASHIYHPSADTTARTMTIPANASVPYPIGTALTFVNDTSAGVMTIAITSDVMILAGAGTTGSRSLAANGIATALKIGAARWIISGTGVT